MRASVQRLSVARPVGVYRSAHELARYYRIDARAMDAACAAGRVEGAYYCPESRRWWVLCPLRVRL